MTWRELLQQLKDMEKVKHTSMDKPVTFDMGDCMANVDIVESLTTGDVYLTKMIAVEEDDGEA